MTEIEKQILDEYAKNFKVEYLSYQIMGKMLDSHYVEERLRLFDIKNMYIYGGTYIAVQLYRSVKLNSCVKGVVDRDGKIILEEDVQVLTFDEFKKIYCGEKIIVTPIRYFNEIKKNLETFVKETEIVNVVDFVMGII